VENLAELLEQCHTFCQGIIIYIYILVISGVPFDYTFIMFVYISPYLVVQFRDLNPYSGVLTTFMGPWGLQNLGADRWAVACWEANDAAADFGVAIGQILGNRRQRCSYV
jgi:hypothetical protein